VVVLLPGFVESAFGVCVGCKVWTLEFSGRVKTDPTRNGVYIYLFLLRITLHALVRHSHGLVFLFGTWTSIRIGLSEDP